MISVTIDKKPAALSRGLVLWAIVHIEMNAAALN